MTQNQIYFINTQMRPSKTKIKSPHTLAHTHTHIQTNSNNETKPCWPLYEWNWNRHWLHIQSICDDTILSIGFVYCYTFFALSPSHQFLESLEIPILFITSTLVCAFIWSVSMLLYGWMCVFSPFCSPSHRIFRLDSNDLSWTIEMWKQKGNRVGVVECLEQ